MSAFSVEKDELAQDNRSNFSYVDGYVGLIASPKKGDRSLRTAFEAGKFVINPHTNLTLLAWDIMVVLLIFVVAIRTPYETAFGHLSYGYQSSGPEKTLLYYGGMLISFFFLCDMVLQFFVSYPDPDEQRWVSKPYDIVRRYLRSMFLVDLVSTLPYELLIKGVASATETAATPAASLIACYLGLLKIGRLFRLNRLIMRYEARIALPYKHINLARLVILLLLTVHWVACSAGILRSVQKYQGGKDASTWVDMVRDTKPGFFRYEEHETSFELYKVSVYWSVMTSTGVGYGDVNASNSLEALWFTVVMVCTGFCWAYIIGNMCTIFSLLSKNKVDSEQELDSLNVMLEDTGCPSELRWDIREFFIMRKASYHRAKQLHIFSVMSPGLQTKLASHYLRGLLTRVWFLQPVDEYTAFSRELFMAFELSMFPPQELFRLPKRLKVLTKGKVLKGARVLRKHDHWGEIDVLLQDERLHDRISSGLSLTFVELMSLHGDKLLRISRSYPEQRAPIRIATLFWAVTRAAARQVVSPSWHKVAQGASASGDLSVSSSGKQASPKKGPPTRMSSLAAF